MSNMNLTDQEKEALEIMRSAGVFEVKRGEAILNFNAEGKLIDIWIRVLGYRRDKYQKS